MGARIAWRDVGGPGAVLAVGGPLGGAREPDEAGRRAPLGVGRCAHGAAVLGSRLLVCGGYDRARVLRAAEAYCPAANAWAPLPDMRTARARFPAARLGDALFAVGGSDGHNELDSVDVFEVRPGPPAPSAASSRRDSSRSSAGEAGRRRVAHGVAAAAGRVALRAGGRRGAARAVGGGRLGGRAQPARDALLPAQGGAVDRGPTAGHR